MIFFWKIEFAFNRYADILYLHADVLYLTHILSISGSENSIYSEKYLDDTILLSLKNYENALVITLCILH